jgi:Flp pilus assembly protein TadG
MLCRSPRPRRRGTTLVEYALVLHVLILLTFGSVIIGMGVFRNNDVAALAREGARWAIVHGGTWKQGNNKTNLTTAADVYNNAILPRAGGLDTTQLTYTVTWLDAGQMPTYTGGSGLIVPNQVTVTVNYSWVPQLFLGSMTLTGSSTMTMVY